MRIAVFSPENIYTAWSLMYGLSDTLARMGHEVSFYGFRGEAKIQRATYPTPEELRHFCAIIISGPEHIGKYLNALYPEWDTINVPKAAWLHESMEREDYGQLDPEPIKKLADSVFCPARQDEKFGFQYLPFGVDTAMFNGGCGWGMVRRSIELGFIGLVYEKREKFLRGLQPELRQLLTVGSCEVRDIRGIDLRASAKLYAENLRRINIFLNLPSLSRLVTTKVYEIMACATALVTPFVEDSGFENGKHLQFYDNNPLGPVMQLNNQSEYCRSMAQTGQREVQDKHCLEYRLIDMLKAITGRDVTCEMPYSLGVKDLSVAT